MEANLLEKVHAVLDCYLENNNHRKTPERYAVLDAVYQMQYYFSLEELGQKLEGRNFRVSRATLYNTLKLFMQLRLVIKHYSIDGVRYEACYDNKDHIRQMCTVCGKTQELNSPDIVKLVDEIKYRRFHKSGFSLYVYGICSTCQRKISLNDKKKLKDKKK